MVSGKGKVRRVEIIINKTSNCPFSTCLACNTIQKCISSHIRVYAFESVSVMSFQIAVVSSLQSEWTES